MFEKTKNFCDSLLKLGLPCFDLIVYKDGECILRYMNGYNDIENKIKLTGNEKYYIYSCSKLITCTAALQLYEKGLFSLEDRLSDYLPEFSDITVKTENGIKKAENPILIKHLFEMTAGLSYDLSTKNISNCKQDTDGRCDTRELMKYLAKDPLLFEPGKRWEYSLCHDVLAALVEVISGQKFNHYVTENIFKPLNIKDATFLFEDERKCELAKLYKFDKENNIAVDFNKNNVYIAGTEHACGGAGCVSTVEDYIKFLEGLRTYKLLRPETLKLMTTDRLSQTQKSTYWLSANYGYGLGVWCHKNGGRYHDFGWGGAAGAYASVNIENGISIFFASHLLSSPVQEIRTKVTDFVLAELFKDGDTSEIEQNLKISGNYNLTY